MILFLSSWSSFAFPVVESRLSDDEGAAEVGSAVHADKFARSYLRVTLSGLHDGVAYLLHLSVVVSRYRHKTIT